MIMREDQREILLIEFKWSNMTYKKAKEVLKKLELKALALEDRTRGYNVRYGLLANKVEKKDELRREQYEMNDLEDILRLA